MKYDFVEIYFIISTSLCIVALFFNLFISTYIAWVLAIFAIIFLVAAKILMVSEEEKQK